MAIKGCYTSLQAGLLGFAAFQLCRQLGLQGGTAAKAVVSLPLVHVSCALITGIETTDPWILPRDSWQKSALIGAVAIGTLAIGHGVGTIFYPLFNRILKLLPKQNALVYLCWAKQVGGAVQRTAIFNICVLGPIAEEILFRGFVQSNLEKIHQAFDPEGSNSLTARRRRVAITSGLFGVWHVSRRQGWMNLLLIPGTALMGSLLGEISDFAGLLPSILAHMAQNSFATARVLLGN